MQTPEEQGAAQQVTRPGRGGRPAGPHARGVALGDAGTEGARARRAVAAPALGCGDRPRGARVFLRVGKK